MITAIRSKGAAAWVSSQFAMSGSRYTSGGTDAVDRDVNGTQYCALPAQRGDPYCWRDSYSSEPLLWDFYRNATTQQDQLRQRVALALQHLLVVSNVEVNGTYGFRTYFNMLLDRSLGNYRDLLREVILSPLMGAYLDHVNNDPVAPNENFGRELLQLFTLGPCALNGDGSLTGGTCRPIYDNDTVRAYAFALTGWTYPAGGSATWTCMPTGSNCPYYGGKMVSLASLRDGASRKLLSGITVNAGSTASQALEKVLDSVMQHPNIAPFIAQRLIQHFTVSNPKPAYVKRVADVFKAGKYSSDGFTFGSGAKGDLKAVVAAILLDQDARSTGTPVRDAGFLREPALFFTGAIRGLNGYSDGTVLGWYWGQAMKQHMFRPPSVFNFFSPSYPVAGTKLSGPEFGIHNANGALSRLNFLSFLIDNGGAGPDSSRGNSIGTTVRVDAFLSSAGDAGALVDRLSQLAIGKNLSASSRKSVIDAVSFWTESRGSDWKQKRVREAAYLIFASPDYQVQR